MPTLNSTSIMPLEKEKVMSPIVIKKSHRGLLRKSLGAKPGQPIPIVKLQARKKTAGPAEKKRIIFAENSRHWSKG